MILLPLVIGLDSTTDGIFTLFYVRYYNITVMFLHQQRSDIFSGPNLKHSLWLLNVEIYQNFFKSKNEFLIYDVNELHSCFIHTLDRKSEIN